MINDSRYRNLGIVQGDLYAKRDPRPFVVRQASAELREWIVARLVGRRKSRKLYRIQSGETHPLAEPMELAVELRGLGFSSWRAIITPQAKQLAALHGMDFQTGEFDPPTPAQQQRAA